MRKIIEYTLILLDGVFEGPQIQGYMNYRDVAYMRDGLGQLLTCDAMLMGRTNTRVSRDLAWKRSPLGRKD
jgi:hypothetical protein